jgi:SAM-dependent methyltransferase
METNNIEHKGPIVSTVGDSSIIECQSCGFTHQFPLPSKEHLTKLYETELYESERPNYFKDMEEDEAWWMDTYRNHYALVAPHVTGRRLLEIGSGPGYFLKCGQELGWDVLGVEPSEAAHRYATEDLHVPSVKGFFSSELLKNEAPFDVIYMNLVLEHIPEPGNFIRQARSLLKKDGIIFILVPNDFNSLQRSARTVLNLPEWWVVPMHLNYFSFDGLSHLLSSTGFSQIDSLATFPMEFFLLSGDNYVGNPVLGRACHGRRKQFEENLYREDVSTLNAWYRSLAREGLGRECIVIGRRTENS